MILVGRFCDTRATASKRSRGLISIRQSDEAIRGETQRNPRTIEYLGLLTDLERKRGTRQDRILKMSRYSLNFHNIV